MYSYSTFLLALPTLALAQATAYGQCGGQGWGGATTCVSGYECKAQSQYYSQCVPGTASVAPVSSSAAPPRSTFSTVGTPTTTGPASTTVPAGSAGSGPGTTLQSGWLWIRADEEPNFHKYLQTDPQYTTGIAVMDDYTTAGQFNIIDGQLVELINPSTNEMLYMNVSPPTASETYIPVSFSTSKNTYGTFAFSGDAVTWTVDSIDRPNDSAWYICTGQQLYINLGSYDYLTPADCADQTINYYNGATAVD